jgi:hypothetical protein
MRCSGLRTDGSSALAKRSSSDALAEQATSALQSRGGDGFFLADSDQSGINQTVFPSTKSAVIVICSLPPQG